MPKEQRMTSRKSGRWWKLLLLLPVLDIRPSLPGKSGDHQVDELRRARQELLSRGGLERGNLIPPVQPVQLGTEFTKKNWFTRVVEWVINRLK